MVQQHRSGLKTTYAKDVSPMRNMSNLNKYAYGSSPNQSSGFLLGSSSRLTVPAPNAPTTSRNAEKWKYNNMVNNDRDKFNNLHFC